MPSPSVPDPNGHPAAPIGFTRQQSPLGTPDEVRHPPADLRSLLRGGATIITRLAAGGPVGFAGDFHWVVNLTLTPRIPAELRPRILVSGSSEPGLAAARALDALPVQYPAPATFIAGDGDGPLGHDPRPF